MKKPKSSGIKKQEDIIKEYMKVTTCYAQNTKQSFRNLDKMTGIRRDSISYHVNRENIIKALKKLNDKTYLNIVEELPISLFKGLTTLREKNKEEIQNFFIIFGKNIKNITTTNRKDVNLLCDSYWRGEIQNYSDFEKYLYNYKNQKQEVDKKPSKKVVNSKKY